MIPFHVLNEVALARTVRENPEIPSSVVQRIIVAYLRHDDIALQEEKGRLEDRLGEIPGHASLPRLRRRVAEAELYEGDVA